VPIETPRRREYDARPPIIGYDEGLFYGCHDAAARGNWRNARRGIPVLRLVDGPG